MYETGEVQQNFKNPVEHDLSKLFQEGFLLSISPASFTEQRMSVGIPNLQKNS